MPPHVALFIVAALLPAASPGGQVKVPLIHTTDLYHPPDDPDDHIDLATVFALDEFDLRAVVFDTSHPRLDSHAPGAPVMEPGFVPVAQLCFLTGRSVPCASGLRAPFGSPVDKALDRPRQEQAGVELLLRALRDSPAPAIVTVLGSARQLMAAFNREPELVKRKVRTVVLNAGPSDDDTTEWNVRLDVHAYVGLFRSGLPIDWYPCHSRLISNSNTTDRNSFWRASHADLFRGLPPPLFAWFVHAFAGNQRGDMLRALREQGKGSAAQAILSGRRNLWCTASLALAAGRVLAKVPDGWRFASASLVPAGTPVHLLALDPVTVTIRPDGHTKWELSSKPGKIRLFRRDPGPAHEPAMTEALNALLRSLPVE